jgi:hypothetical protein
MSRRRRRTAPAATFSSVKHLASLLALFVIGCSGGGGCSSCAGVAPLPGGFDTSKSIENAGSARITSKGFAWINEPANLSAIVANLFGATGGVLNYPIGTVGPSDVGGGLSYTICPNGAQNGDCTLAIDFTSAALQINSAAPHDITITGTLPVHLELPVYFEEDVFGQNIASCTMDVALDGDGMCPADATSAGIDLNVDISIEVDENTGHVRYGYSMIDIATADLSSDSLSNALNLCSDNGACDFVAGIIDNDTIKGFVIDAFHSTLDGFLQSQLEGQLCQKADETLTPSCPTGTNDVSGTCRYGTTSSDPCVSLLLGTDGHANLGALLASISPGTSGGLDFLFSAGGIDTGTDGIPWGDLDPKSGGGTIGLLGGAEPNPLSNCIKMSDLAKPRGIPIPQSLYDENIPGWPASDPGPDISIAVSEEFTNYAMSSLYNSGMLCIGITSEQVPQLNSGLLSLLSQTIPQLGLQSESQQIGIVVRPSQPPTVIFGNGTDADTDPVIRVKLDQASFDFYIFSLDRFIRFMTATFDLDVPVNLSVGPMGITPTVGTLGVTNGKVTNSQLLPDDPATLASSIQSIIASEVGMALGAGIAPIDYNSSLSALGIQLFIPDSVAGQGSPGIHKLTDGSHNYLGVFASFELASAMMPVPPVETSAHVVNKIIDPAGLRLRTIRPENTPRVRVELGSPADGADRVEYAVRVDHALWHPFTRDRVIELTDPSLRLQGRHVVEAAARIVGQPLSLDRTPAEAAFTIDVDPPTVKIKDGGDGNVTLAVDDLVSDADHALVRTRLDVGDWSDWKTASAMHTITTGDAHFLEVEAKDEDGNIGTAQQALLRGRGDGAAAGCGCEVAVGSSSAPRGAAWLLAIGVAAIFTRIARRKTASKPALAPRPSAKSADGRALRALTALATLSVAFSWAGCSCGGDTQAAATTGDAVCTPPKCQTLEPGLIGEYTSVATDGTTLWVAGYSEANYEEDHHWGDLVVGKWSGTKVDWDSVDGVPDDPVDGTAFDESGYRGGVTGAGDDVGLWTSIALDASGNPAVAYYDRTHTALKFAQLSGKKWDVSTVDASTGVELGRYAKLLFVGGSWVIAYQSLGGGGDQGAAVSKVRVATSTSGTPGASGWTFEDAAVERSSPCRARFCSGGQVCDKTTLRCETPATSCNPTCASGTSCLNDGSGASCVAILDSTVVESYPDAIGDYITAAPTSDGGVGIAYYDRTHGNLWAAAKSGGTWQTHLVDGQTADGTNTSDVGIGASLFIDTSGAWHITYVDGITEAVKYVKLDGQFALVNGPEVVDDGVNLNGVRNDDGQHLVGDDSNLFVTSGGDVHVSYQDSTAGTLRFATGSPMGDHHKWTVSVEKIDGFAGAFSHIVTVNGQLQVESWWRKGGMYATGDVTVTTP